MHLLMHLFIYVFTSRGLYLEEWGQNSTSSKEYSVLGECRLQKCHSTYRCVILSKLVKVLDKIFTCDRLKGKICIRTNLHTQQCRGYPCFHVA